MVETAVTRRLSLSESVIYSSTAEFNIPSKSVIGTHALYFTNRGRVLAYDSGGMFGTEKVVEYAANILTVDVKFESSLVRIKNSVNHQLTFDIAASYAEFIKIYSQNEKASFHFTQNNQCFIKVDDTYQLVNYLIETKSMKLENQNGECIIPFSRIKTKSYSQSSGILLLNGLFDDSELFLNEIELFFPHPKDFNLLKLYIEKAKNIFEFFSEEALVSSIRIKNVAETDSHNEYLSLLIYEKGEYKILNEKSFTIIEKFNPIEDAFYFDSNSNSLLMIKENTPYLLLFNYIDEFIQKVKNDSDRLYRNFGQISGTYQAQTFENVPFNLFYDDTGYHLFMEDTFSFTEKLLFNDTFIDLEEEHLFISSTLGSFKLYNIADKETFFSIFINCNGEEKLPDFGFYENGIPFTFDQDDNGFSFTQSSILQARIQNKDITDISVIEQNIDSTFSMVKICTSNHETVVYLHEKVIKKLIYSTFYYKKLPLLDKLRPEQLFTSWSRQVNDYLLYHYFGQFFVINAEIQAFQKEDLSNQIKQIKLINILYYGLQSQKKIVDTVSVYLPAMLENEQQEILTSIGGMHSETPYNHLQKHLLSISSQITRHINEIQSSLNAISFAIIPQQTMDEFLKDRLIRNALTAGAVTALLPPAGLFMAINTWFSYSDAKSQEKIRKENEQYKIGFYLNKALDSYQHFQEVMMPFYISETNQKMFQTLTQVAKQYQPVINHAALKGYFLDKLAEMYTFKQLPMDDFDIKRKAELIEELHGSTENVFNSINQFRNEVKIDVQKSISSNK